MKKGLFAFVLFIGLFGLLKIFSFSYDSEKRNSQAYNGQGFIKALDLPADLEFAGEKIPTELFDVAERMDRELTVNTYWQSQTLLLFKRAHRWFPVIEPILRKHNVPDDFKYLAVAESGLLNVVSPAGATGFWQFLQAPAKERGLIVTPEIDERYHVEKETEAACAYLKDAYRDFGSWSMAAASYNMGIEGLKRQVRQQKVKNYYDLLLNEETSRYVFRLMAIKEVFKNPEKYNFKIRKKDLYPAIPVNYVSVDTPITDLVQFAEWHNINYKTLKIFNPWLRQSSMPNKEGRTFMIKIPDPDFSYTGYLDRIAREDSIQAR